MAEPTTTSEQKAREKAGQRLHAMFALVLNTRLADDERRVGIADDWEALPNQDHAAWIETAAALSKEGQGEAEHRLSREDGERLKDLEAAIELALPAMRPGPKSSEVGHVKEDCALVHVDHFLDLTMAASGLVDALAKVTGETEAAIHARLIPTQPCKSCIGEDAARKARNEYAAALSQPPQDDVERLREKLLAIKAAFERVPARNPESQEQWSEQVDAAIAAALSELQAPAPDVERLGGEEGPKPLRFSERALWNETEDQRVHAVLARLARMRAAAREGEELRAAVETLRDEFRQRGLTTASAMFADRLDSVLDANPPPPLEHSKEEVDAFRELGKRLLDEEAAEAVARRRRIDEQVCGKRLVDFDDLGEAGKESLRYAAQRDVALAWNIATGHADFPLEPAPEHSKGGLGDDLARVRAELERKDHALAEVWDEKDAAEGEVKRLQALLAANPGSLQSKEGES